MSEELNINFHWRVSIIPNSIMLIKSDVWYKVLKFFKNHVINIYVWFSISHFCRKNNNNGIYEAHVQIIPWYQVECHIVLFRYSVLAIFNMCISTPSLAHNNQSSWKVYISWEPRWIVCKFLLWDWPLTFGTVYHLIQLFPSNFTVCCLLFVLFYGGHLQPRWYITYHYMLWHWYNNLLLQYPLFYIMHPFPYV